MQPFINENRNRKSFSSAIALLLVPKGMQKLELDPLVMSFLVGAFLFMSLDIYLSKKKEKRQHY